MYSRTLRPPLGRLEVGRDDGERAPDALHPPEEERRCTRAGAKQPLVRVEDDRVGPLPAGEEGAHLGEARRRAGVRRVDVHPEPLAAAERGDLRAAGRRDVTAVVPTVADDRDRAAPRRAVLRDRPARARPGPSGARRPSGIFRRPDDPEAEDDARLVDGGVGELGAVDDAGADGPRAPSSGRRGRPARGRRRARSASREAVSASCPSKPSVPPGARRSSRASGPSPAPSRSRRARCARGFRPGCTRPRESRRRRPGRSRSLAKYAMKPGCCQCVRFGSTRRSRSRSIASHGSGSSGGAGELREHLARLSSARGRGASRASRSSGSGARRPPSPSCRNSSGGKSPFMAPSLRPARRPHGSATTVVRAIPVRFSRRSVTETERLHFPGASVRVSVFAVCVPAAAEYSFPVIERKRSSREALAPLPLGRVGDDADSRRRHEAVLLGEELQVVDRESSPPACRGSSRRRRERGSSPSSRSRPSIGFPTSRAAPGQLRVHPGRRRCRSASATAAASARCPGTFGLYADREKTRTPLFFTRTSTLYDRRGSTSVIRTPEPIGPGRRVEKDRERAGDVPRLEAREPARRRREVRPGLLHD